jgi:glycerophosphoryl diester phosphodiesterase
MVSRDVTLYAHRGAAAELPENTLPSFRRAIELGADAIETDAHLTRDGHLVLMHDPSGARTAGVARAIGACELAEIRAWNACARFEGTFAVPTLAEALEELPGVPFNVDCKTAGPRAAAALVDVVRRQRAHDRVLIASFDARTLRAVRALGYEGRTGLARAEVARLVLSPSWALRAVPLYGHAAQLPVRAAGVRLDTPAFIAKCRALGFVVHYWTINEPREAARLIALGADGIMTDDPRAIAPAVRAERG